MRLLICAGGTGGGVYPALAVLRALQGSLNPAAEDYGQGSDRSGCSQPLEVLWVGGRGGIEKDLIVREDIPFLPIPAAGVHGVGFMALPGNLWQIGKGIFAARSILNRFRPQVIFFTGGYLAVPVALACRLPGWRTPRPKNLLYVPDIEPGLALRFLARLADQIALTTEESMGYFADQSIVTVTGYPTRPGLRSWTRQAARNAFALAPELPTLLVFGGSKGARSINRALFSILPQLLPEMQIVHVTGHLDWPEVDSIRRSLGTGWSNRYHAYPYLYKEMGAALATADLVLSRAGASILGEYPLFGLPAILVPYPYAWRYQEVNARYLSDKGAAIVLADGDLDSKLLPTIQMLMRDRTQRDVMQDTMQSLARPNASGSIAGLICSLAPLTGAGRM